MRQHFAAQRAVDEGVVFYDALVGVKSITRQEAHEISLVVS